MRCHHGGDNAGQFFGPEFVGIINQFGIFIDKARIKGGGPKLGMFENFQIIRNGGFNAEQARIFQSPLAAFDGIFPGHRADDHFSQHGIVKRRDFITGINRGISAHAGAAGRIVTGNPAETGQEVVFGVFGVDPKLDRIAAPDNLVLLETQGQSGRHPYLFFDYIHAGYRFGNGMFDLNAGIHFHKVKTIFIV